LAENPALRPRDPQRSAAQRTQFLLIFQSQYKKAKNVPDILPCLSDNLKTGSFFDNFKGARDGKSGTEMSALTLWGKFIIKMDN
jgi:hypothetical protein